jgi:sodium-dependent dicarboxylate transporter 2/3/5
VQRRRSTLALLGAGLFLLIWLGPTPHGLSVAGKGALATFVVCVVYWISGALPGVITSLLPLVLLPATGALTTVETYALFGNEAVFFILGAFLLAAALMGSGLSTRVALAVLRRFGRSPRRLLRSFFLMNALMACVMSQHAVAAMSLSIATQIADVLEMEQRRSNYARALFLALAWGSSIGGLATLLGGARAPLAIAILRETTGETYSFAAWTLATWPVVVVTLAAAWVVLLWSFPVDIRSTRRANELIERRIAALGRASLREWAIGAITLATLAAWITLGERFGLATISLGAVVVIFTLRLVRWPDVERYVNWGVLLMYGGAIVLGAAMKRTGAAVWLAQSLVGDSLSAPPILVAVLSAVSILLSAVMTNSAVVAIVLPVVLSLAPQVGVAPRVTAPAVAVPAGLSFMLPVGTPSNAIAFSSGHLALRDMLGPGAVLSVIAWIVFNLSANYYWPLIGLGLAAGD